MYIWLYILHSFKLHKLDMKNDRSKQQVAVLGPEHI